ncbi:hypothetical protein SUGI_0216510 [Cryptomeria japonica]|uniref:probable protein phosphatase 2C 55 n=1 Tax=Cryptomeria japonica TaxID=3369 RepID=UPI002408D22E|nr:probable protein phosphatase 2C 55 [Cryptomeria japonica]GLJ13620.1 hypothetical protein SUGI_0216510 [Cryptomeria japonica]
MNHGIVLLVVLATLSVADHHGCNGQQSNPTSLPLPPPLFPPPPSEPAIVVNCCNEQFAPPQPFLLPPPPPPFLYGSDPYNYYYYNDDSKSGINIVMIVVVAAIAIVLLIAIVLIERKFRTISLGLELLYTILGSIVKSLGGISTGIGNISKGVDNINSGIGKISSSVDKILDLLGDRVLKLQSGACYLPKEKIGGQDAHFICTAEQAIGVADGVGGQTKMGVDSAIYACELMAHSVAAIQEEPRGSIDLSRVLEKAYVSTKSKGSSTACMLALSDQGLHAVNLGDSGFLVVRDGCTIFRSPVQQHEFNYPYQLESGGSDLPSSAQMFTLQVTPGDVIIAGTDGLFDNLYNSEVTAVVVHAVRAGLGPQVTAQKIAALARQRAQDKHRQTPFSTAAQDAGITHYGGKLDDITVVVSYVASSNSNPEE